MENEEEECDTDLERQNVEELYDYVRHLHQTEASEPSFDVQHPSLIPVLRAYQSQAVNWMLKREKYKSSSSPQGPNLFLKCLLLPFRCAGSVEIYNVFFFFLTGQRLHFLWREAVTVCGKKLFYNPYTGW